MSTSLSFYLVTLLNAGSIFGRLGAGAFGVALGQFNVLFATCLISTVLVWAWLSVDSNATTIVFAVFYGAFSGGKSIHRPHFFPKLAVIHHNIRYSEFEGAMMTETVLVM